MRACVRACVCVCVCCVCVLGGGEASVHLCVGGGGGGGYNIIVIYSIFRLYVYISVDLVKRGVFTLVGEIRRKRKDCNYYCY